MKSETPEKPELIAIGILNGFVICGLTSGSAMPISSRKDTREL